ncbi:unnamed protein product [Trichobilharzia regenti]|nr:unnamed protein product [Trichobilharzia regenti]
MSDQESDIEQDVLDDTIVNKYKMAAEVTNGMLKHHSVIHVINESMRKYLSIAFPTSISLNNIMCHYSPIDGEENDPVEIKNGDLVKINVGAHVDGYAAIVGHTMVVGASQNNKVTGKKADVIVAAHTAAEAILRTLRPNIENTRASEVVGKATLDFNCHPVEGMQCHQMKRLIYDAEKSIVFSPTEEQKKTIEKCTFDTNDVWNVDIIVSTGDGKPREHKARTTLYKKNETLYQLKMKASRLRLQINVWPTHSISGKLLPLKYTYLFSALEDVKKARLGITECIKHGVIQPLSVYCEKDGKR